MLAHTHKTHYIGNRALSSSVEIAKGSGEDDN